MDIDFLSVLKEKREIVWNEINKYLSVRIEKSYPNDIVSKYSDAEDLHWKLVREYPERRGKYVRPTLTLLACEAMGGDPQKAIKTAAAMQTSEDWILNHDDFEDDSEERRGKPCLHRMYSPELAVNAGDSLHIIMWKMLRDNEEILGPRKAFEVMDEFYKMLMRTTLGQTTEISWIQQNKLVTADDDVYFIFDGKTVYYTIAGPMRLGAIVAGATKEQLDEIFKVGVPLGRAFQTRDDLLNLVGDREKYGKEIGGDILEGKRTLMLVHLVRTAEEVDRKRVIDILKKPRKEKGAEDIAFVIDLMNKYGSIEYGKKKAEEFTNQALSAFDGLTFFKPGKARDELRAGIKFMLTREK
jgi:geranylgeranyl diphosphate synthase type II